MKNLKKLTPFFMAIAFCIIILLTIKDYGITWDEGVYFLCGASYFNWLENPSLETIDKYWSFKFTSNEHPPLVPLLGEMTRSLFHKKLNLMDRVSSFRMAVLFFVFFLNLALFSFVSRLYGRKIAFIVSLSFFFLPRIFFHSHLAALDYPVTAMWFLVIYSYWRGMGQQKWVYCSAILLGLALLTKLNAYFIYVPVVFFWLLTFNRKIISLLLGKLKFSLREILPLFSKIVPMFIIPPLVLTVFWPYMWKNPLSRILEYPLFSLKLTQVRYTYYFGEVFTHAPWHYPFVWSLITIPLIVLIMFFIGLFKIAQKPYTRTDIFILFNALLPLIIVALPMVPKYDAERLFLPAFPFICIISGLGIKQIFDFARKFKAEKLAFIFYMVLFSLTLYNSIIRYHPYQSSYFNEIIGGIKGAERRGFEVEYWGNAFIGSLPFLNKHSESTFWVYHHPARYRFYDARGLLKKEIKFGDKDNADYLVLLIRQGSFNKEMWRYYECEEPVFSVRVLNTNLLNIYKLR